MPRSSRVERAFANVEHRRIVTRLADGACCSPAATTTLVARPCSRHGLCSRYAALGQLPDLKQFAVGELDVEHARSRVSLGWYSAVKAVGSKY